MEKEGKIMQKGDGKWTKSRKTKEYKKAGGEERQEDKPSDMELRGGGKIRGGGAGILRKGKLRNWLGKC